MRKFLTLGFRFCENLYHSIIMIKKKSDRTIYKITIMNGELEKLLHGNQIITEMNGYLQLEIGENNKQEELRIIIGEVLSKALQLPLIKTFKSPG
jgi:hypothetical protein